jgi:hypothetical protein
MLCPYCNKEMENGYIQSGTIIIWTPKKHKISLLPRNDGRDIHLAKKPLGGATVYAYRCNDCKRIIINY